MLGAYWTGDPPRPAPMPPRIQGSARRTAQDRVAPPRNRFRHPQLLLDTRLMICSSFCRNLCFRQEASRSRAVRTWGRGVSPPEPGWRGGASARRPKPSSPAGALPSPAPGRAPSSLGDPRARGRRHNPSPGNSVGSFSCAPEPLLLQNRAPCSRGGGGRGQPLPRAARMADPELPSPSAHAPPTPTRTSLGRVSRRRPVP